MEEKYRGELEKEYKRGTERDRTLRDEREKGEGMRGRINELQDQVGPTCYGPLV